MKNKQSGFFLFDALVASLILSLGFVAYMKLQNISLKRTTDSAKVIKATIILDSFIEELRANSNPAVAANDMLSSMVPAGAGQVFSIVSNNVAANPDQDCLNNGNLDFAANNNFIAKGNWCNQTDMIGFITARVQNQMSTLFGNIAGRAVLCVRRGVLPRQYRFSLIWSDPVRTPPVGATPAGIAINALSVASCPAYGPKIAIAINSTNDNVNDTGADFVSDGGFINFYTII